MREMTTWRIETAARRKGRQNVDVSLIETIYREWSEAARSVTQTLVWTADAQARIARVPTFVRGTVVKEIEAYAREIGSNEVTAAMWDAVVDRWATAMTQEM
jgi:hypothetical protein